MSPHLLAIRKHGLEKALSSWLEAIDVPCQPSRTQPAAPLSVIGEQRRRQRIVQTAKEKFRFA